MVMMRGVFRFFAEKGLQIRVECGIIIYANRKWPVGQEAKTTPSHGVIMGSIPVRVTSKVPAKTLKVSSREIIYMSVHIIEKGA